ncbi:hypothetical protein WMY93_000679 [Mugilogobius chulae]|uniref:HAT C-terminal dimerisation domain-containing protein n=1 Tax=Mugilogobius chulae TaxID=88201 RepID=A0AAW0Q1L4_9GOBI
MEELRPKQDCATRWKSTFYMLQSYLKNKDAIVATPPITNAAVAPLTGEEWTAVEEMCTVLHLFEEVTVEISGESCAWPFQKPEQQMKPFRGYPLLLPNLSNREPTQVTEEEESRNARESAVWSFFNKQVAGTVATRNPTADAILEVRSYLKEPLFDKNEDPLKWKSRALVYPRISKVMAKKLCFVATSVPSERVFSKTGQIFSDRRNRLKPKRLRALVFLNANLKGWTKKTKSRISGRLFEMNHS